MSLNKRQLDFTKARLGLILMGLLSQLFCTQADPAILVLDPVPEAVEQTYVSLSGQTAPGDIVQIEGGVSEIKVEADPLTGRFEAMIGLQLEQINLLTVFSWGPLDDLTDSATLSVKQVRPAVSMPDPNSVPIPEKPELSPLPEQTAAVEILLLGYARQSDSVRIIEARGESYIESGADGLFSVTIPLQLNALNTIIVAGVNSIGIQGESAAVSILQLLPEPQPDPENPETLPATPVLAPHETPTWRICQTFNGSADPNVLIRVEGGAFVADGQSGPDGRFLVGVELTPLQVNTLQVYAINQNGVASEPAVAEISQTQAPQVVKHPVILAHGFAGFRELFGFLEYFNGIRELYEQKGIETYITEVAPMQTIESRAQQLKKQILQITSGKVNIIAHSMGSLDSRYLIAHLGMADRVESLTTIAGPHYGVSIADVAFDLADSNFEFAVDFLMNLFDQDLNSIWNLTQQYMTTIFNPATPDDPGVAYYSYAGVADPIGVTGFRLHAFFDLSWAIVYDHEGDNDGLASVKTSKWGQYLGEIHADHLAEIGHIWGLGQSFDYQAFYLDQAYFLQEAGH